MVSQLRARAYGWFLVVNTPNRNSLVFNHRHGHKEHHPSKDAFSGNRNLRHRAVNDTTILIAVNRQLLIAASYWPDSRGFFYRWTLEINAFWIAWRDVASWLELHRCIWLFRFHLWLVECWTDVRNLNWSYLCRACILFECVSSCPNLRPPVFFCKTYFSASNPHMLPSRESSAPCGLSALPSELPRNWRKQTNLPRDRSSLSS